MHDARSNARETELYIPQFVLEESKEITYQPKSTESGENYPQPSSSLSMARVVVRQGYDSHGNR